MTTVFWAVKVTAETSGDYYYGMNVDGDPYADWTSHPEYAEKFESPDKAKAMAVEIAGDPDLLAKLAYPDMRLPVISVVLAELTFTEHEAEPLNEVNEANQKNGGKPMNVNVPENLKAIPEAVLKSYINGTPVVILDKDEGVLHGRETLEVISQTGVTLKALTIAGCDRQEFEDSDLPEFCEAARRVWLENGFEKWKGKR